MLCKTYMVDCSNILFCQSDPLQPNTSELQRSYVDKYRESICVDSVTSPEGVRNQDKTKQTTTLPDPYYPTQTSTEITYAYSIQVSKQNMKRQDKFRNYQAPRNIPASPSNAPGVLSINLILA